MAVGLKGLCFVLEHNCPLTQFCLGTIFVSSHVYPENPGGARVIVGSLNMGSDIFIRHYQDLNSQPVPSRPQ